MTAQAWPRVCWREEFECSDPIINEQHRMLFSIVNRMVSARDAGDVGNGLECLDELVMHTMEHFRYEEEVLRRHGYTDLQKHLREHMVLLERTLTYRHDVARGVTSLTHLMQFLVTEVIVEHMIEADRLYFGCLTG